MYILNNSTLKGNWATLLLSTDSTGSIDFHRLADEIDVLIDSSPNGIYSNGTAGEFYSQTREEFELVNQLLAEKCETAAIPFQIGASFPTAQEALSRVEIAASLNPGAIQVILPDWFPINNEGIISYMTDIAKAAGNIPLVLYNPPHAKRVLTPNEWSYIKQEVPSLIGVKVFDNNCSPEWYSEMRKNSDEISVFVPGHHLATGIQNGASGAYSNVACLNPYAAQSWYNSMFTDLESALELENRIRLFMTTCIDPFIINHHYPNHACDRFMACVGGWANVGSKMRWPYSSIPDEYILPVRKKGHNIIPEFV